MADIARQALESETGESVITTQDATQLNGIVTGMIEAVASSEPDEPPAESGETNE